jgi:hypothetical protein
MFALHYIHGKKLECMHSDLQRKENAKLWAYERAGSVRHLLDPSSCGTTPRKVPSESRECPSRLINRVVDRHDLNVPGQLTGSGRASPTRHFDHVDCNHEFLRTLPKYIAAVVCAFIRLSMHASASFELGSIIH